MTGPFGAQVVKELIEFSKNCFNFPRYVFGKELIETIAEMGMDNYKMVSARPHPYEFYLYFDL